jgi:hypothetical protein
MKHRTARVLLAAVASAWAIPAAAQVQFAAKVDW